MTRPASLVLVLLLSAACKDRNALRDAEQAKIVVPPTPPAGTFVIDDFRKLRWIEGRWRGARADGFTFYEQYRFLDDSTIVMYSFADPTYQAPGDSSRISLRLGRVWNDGGTARWFATRLDSAGVDFAPEMGAANFFTWKPTEANQWSATLRWTENGRPMSVEYTMRRFGG